MDAALQGCGGRERAAYGLLRLDVSTPVYCIQVTRVECKPVHEEREYARGAICEVRAAVKGGDVNVEGVNAGHGIERLQEAATLVRMWVIVYVHCLTDL